jgi:hypothetical protein
MAENSTEIPTLLDQSLKLNPPWDKTKHKKKTQKQA